MFPGASFFNGHTAKVPRLLYVSICYQISMSQGPIIRQLNIHGSDVPRVQCPQVPLFPWSFVSISLVLCSQCRMLTDPCSMALSFYSFIYPKTCPCCPIFPVFHVHIFPYYQSPMSRRSYAPRGLRTQYS